MGEPTATRNGPSLDSPEATTDLDEPPSGIRPPAGDTESPPPTPLPPHSLAPAALADLLGTDGCNGLSAAEAAARLERDGPNKVEAAKGTSAWQIFLRQISNSLTLVLVIVMVLSFCIQDYIEASVVAAVILFNIVVGYACAFFSSFLFPSSVFSPISISLRRGGVCVCEGRARFCSLNPEGT